MNSSILIIIIVGCTLIINVGVWFFWKRRFTKVNALVGKYPSTKFKKELKEGSIVRNLIEEIYLIINKSVEKIQSKQSYFENLSHELLTPISIINGKLDLLLQSPHISSEDFEIIDSIIQHLEKLTKVNKSLILLSKIEQDVYDVHQKVNVNELIDQIINVLEVEIRAKKLTIRKENNQTCVIQTNVDLLEILLLNLIKNSIIHNRVGGKILISIDKESIEIQNTGVKETINSLPSTIFQRFHSRSSSKESIGLGLSIVNKICSYLNYSIIYNQRQEFHSFKVYFKK